MKHQYQQRDAEDSLVGVRWGWSRSYYGYRSLGGIPLFAMLAFRVYGPIRWLFASVALGLAFAHVGAWAYRTWFKEKD